MFSQTRKWHRDLNSGVRDLKHTHTQNTSAYSNNVFPPNSDLCYQKYLIPQFGSKNFQDLLSGMWKNDKCPFTGRRGSYRETPRPVRGCASPKAECSFPLLSAPKSFSVSSPGGKNTFIDLGKVPSLFVHISCHKSEVDHTALYLIRVTRQETLRPDAIVR